MMYRCTRNIGIFMLKYRYTSKPTIYEHRYFSPGALCMLNSIQTMNNVLNKTVKCVSGRKSCFDVPEISIFCLRYISIY